MLWQSEKLYKAWLLKEESYKFREAKTVEDAERELHNWLIFAESTEMEEFNACITAFHNWSREIINSIIYITFFIFVYNKIIVSKEES